MVKLLSILLILYLFFFFLSWIFVISIGGKFSKEEILFCFYAPIYVGKKLVIELAEITKEALYAIKKYFTNPCL